MAGRTSWVQGLLNPKVLQLSFLRESCTGRVTKSFPGEKVVERGLQEEGTVALKIWGWLRARRAWGAETLSGGVSVCVCVRMCVYTCEYTSVHVHWMLGLSLLRNVEATSWVATMRMMECQGLMTSSGFFSASTYYHNFLLFYHFPSSSSFLSSSPSLQNWGAPSKPWQQAQRFMVPGTW